MANGIYIFNLDIDYSTENKMMTDEQAQALARVALAAYDCKQAYDSLPLINAKTNLNDAVKKLKDVGIEDEYIKELVKHNEDMFGLTWRAWGVETTICALARKFYSMNHTKEESEE